MARIRTDFVAGALDAALAAGATSMSSPALADLAAVASPDVAAISLYTADSNGRITKKEIVHVTAHTAAATTATILRGREGTSDQEWASGDKWEHAATKTDFNQGLIGLTQYNPASDTAVTTTSTTLVDADSTNAIVTFTAPDSGKVLIQASAGGRNLTTGQPLQLGLRDASGIIAGSGQRVLIGSDLERVTMEFLEVGLTPGTSYTRRLAYSNGGGGTGELRWGTTNERGPLVMKVWAVNL